MYRNNKALARRMLGMDGPEGELPQAVVDMIERAENLLQKVSRQREFSYVQMALLMAALGSAAVPEAVEKPVPTSA